MTPAQRARVREVVLAAMNLPEARRESLLRDVCDEAVRAEAERLLRHGDDADGFLSAPAVDVAAALGIARADGAPDPEATPEAIWGCRIVRVLGRGGMGVVYEAVQEHPRRHVAIKVLHRAFASAAARMSEFEAGVLARLTHPGIAHIYAAGEHREGGERLPFLAMELVPRARSIVRHAREEDLPIRERVGLVLQACEAVAHAHQRGVVHRDLKPGNVLVDADGRVKVIDFGLARITDAELTLTAQLGGSVWGTIASMSPEQLAGRPHDVDARTDIYAIGVILYELLTGSPPFDLRAVPVAEAMQLVLRAEPPDPASLDPRLRGDLAAIILKAMAKDREKRYQWVGDLALDLRDYLAGRPISARTPGPWQRFARWIGQHPVITTAAACLAVAALVLGGTLVSVYFLARRPSEVVVHPDGRSAWLKSAAGHTLYTWPDGASNGVYAAELTRRPAELGGGQVALIMRSAASNVTELAGHLCLYDTARPQTPYWTTRDAPLALPPGYAQRPEIELDGGPLIIADLFEESPGREFATIHGLWPYSPVCVRIFDLAGRELYSLWHDGGLVSMVWLPGPRQLVLAGLCSEARWDERGHSWAAGAYPYIVLALEPRRGHAGDPWALEGGRARDPTVRWCKWLGPPELIRLLPSVELDLEVRSRSTAESFLLATVLVQREDGTSAELCFGLDAAGEETMRWTSDSYKAAAASGELPDPDAFGLYEIEALPPALTFPGER